MFSKAFALATAERAVKTFAQTLVALLSVGATGLLDVDWPVALSAAGLATLLSVLTSIASGTVGNDSPSLVGEELEGGKHRAEL